MEEIDLTQHSNIENKELRELITGDKQRELREKERDMLLIQKPEDYPMKLTFDVDE
jgi:hypothetical protein